MYCHHIGKLNGEKNKDYALLFEQFTGDSSYEVAASALKALNEIDSKKGMTGKKMNISLPAFLRLYLRYAEAKNYNNVRPV